MNIHALHDVYRSHLYLENIHIVDVSLALYFTRKLSSDPVWLFPYGPSGYGKTELVRPFMKLGEEYDIKVMDTVTARAFTSGTLTELEGKRKFIIVPDLAGIIAESEDEKKKLFSQLRTVFDGYIKRETGLASTNANLNDIKVNMLAFSTPSIKRDVEVASLMGTREIMYELPKITHNKKLYEKEISREGRKEISDALKRFIDNINSHFVNPDTETKNKLIEMAERMAVWRVNSIFDKDGFLLEPVGTEVPKRLFTQLNKLYKGLTYIGLTPNETMKILSDVEKGCGNALREKIFDWITTTHDEFGPTRAPNSMTLEQISKEVNASPYEVRRQLMVLRDLGRAELHSSDFGFDSVWSGILW